MSTQEKARTRIPEWTFGDRLRKIRIEAQYDQREFAQRLGVKAPTYAAYETGRAMPRFKDVFSFADRVEAETGVPAYWLIGTNPQPQDYKARVSDLTLERDRRRPKSISRPRGRTDDTGPRAA